MQGVIDGMEKAIAFLQTYNSTKP